MPDFDDLPIIQLRPTPTDAELAAERDAKHEAAIRAWKAEEVTSQPNPMLDAYNSVCAAKPDDEWPIGSVTA